MEFCEELKLENGHHKVVTSSGELFFKIQADPTTGVIDMFAGPALDQMGIFPCRVVPLPGEVYERQYQSLLVEMDGLKKRFGG